MNIIVTTVLSFSFPFSLLVVAGPDQRVCVYDCTTGGSLFEFDACRGTVVNCVSASPCSKILFTGCANGDLKAWNTDASDLKLLRTLRHPKAVKSCAAASRPAGFKVGGRVGDDDASSSDADADADASDQDAGGPLFENGIVATGCADGVIRIWNTGANWDLIFNVVHGCSVQSLAFSANSERIAAGGYDWLVKSWDWNADADADADTTNDSANSAVPSQFVAHRGSISALAFSNKGDILVSGSRDTDVRMWPLSGGYAGTAAPFCKLTSHKNWIRVCVFSKEDDSLATACDELICIWGVFHGTLLKVFPAYMHMTHTCIFSRQTDQLVVAGGIDLAANPPAASEEELDFERRYGSKTSVFEVEGIEAINLKRDGKARDWNAFRKVNELHEDPQAAAAGTVLVEEPFLRVDPLILPST